MFIFKSVCYQPKHFEFARTFIRCFCLIRIKLDVTTELLLKRSGAFRRRLAATLQLLSESESCVDFELLGLDVLDFFDLV